MTSITDNSSMSELPKERTMCILPRLPHLLAWEDAFSSRTQVGKNLSHSLHCTPGFCKWELIRLLGEVCTQSAF